MSYNAEFRRSIDQRDDFWRDQAQNIDWIEPPKTIWQAKDNGHGEWFSDGVLNTSDIALDANIRAGRGDQTALIYDSPVTDTCQKFTYNELRDEVARFAGALRERGIEKGDRIIIYMPMIPQAAIAMLACARLGAIHSVVFGGFAAHELAVRIEDAKPKALLTASCGIEISKVIEYKLLVGKAIEQSSHKPDFCVVHQRPQARADMQEGRDFDWNTIASAASPADPVPVKATDPLYILYTSGTTGQPKGVVRDNGGYAVALDWSMRYLYGIKPGEVWWCASDVGWVVGHSYIVYGPLILGATTILYAGKPVDTPDARAFWRVISEHSAVALSTAPTAFRAIKKEDPDGKLLKHYDRSKFRTLILAGKRGDPPTIEWAQKLLGVPIVDR